ncbi:MAG: hypothetical protein ACTS43_00665 [Candidatus Hodgkinia cicadicola]
MSLVKFRRNTSQRLVNERWYIECNQCEVNETRTSKLVRKFSNVPTFVS